MLKLKKSITFVTFIIVVIVIFGQESHAALPANFQATLVAAQGLDGTSGFGIAPDGRVFILQRTGEVFIYKNGQLLTQPFTTLPSVAAGDRGLIGVAFDPDFLNNHQVYFYYTGSADLLNRLVRFDAATDVGTNGPLILFQTNDPSEQLHVGGTIQFGPDGKLYLSVGDNGYHPNAQDLTNPHGKILRINKDGTIPTDNPFYGQTGKAWEIWAYGFRNPFRFNFDDLTGNLYLGSVGEAATESMYHVTVGANYGWPTCEGACNPPVPGITNPIYQYGHNGGSAAIVAGPVYRAGMFPAEFNGVMFFGDYAQGWIKYMTLDGGGNSTGVFDFYPGAGSVVDMHVSPTDGSLYYITYIPAALYRITYSTGNQIPSAVAGSDVTGGPAPLSVHFSGSGSADPDGDPLTYLWDFGDGTTGTAESPTHVYNQNGRYTVQLKVSDPASSALAFPFIVQVGSPPMVSISSPVNNSNYKAGDTISYTASGTDSTGAVLPDSAFTTTVVFHHQTHIHPFLGPLSSTRTGSFTVPLSGEASAQTWFELIITATDSNGLSTTQSVSIYPLVVNFTYAASSPGLNILLDGIPTPAQTIPSVVNYQHQVSLNAVQNVNGIYYTPDHWSDSGAIKHDFNIPAGGGTLTAFFSELPSFSGDYFNNTTLSGTPTFSRQDPFINFSWNGSSPGSGLPGTDFSTRWTNNVSFMPGNYTFTTTSDDGVRFYVDGNLLIDQWHDQGTTSYSASVNLTGGTHALKMEYYQAGGGSVAKLNWDLTGNPPSGSPAPAPNPNPNPSPSPSPAGNFLTTPWRFTGNNSASEQYQTIDPNSLNGKDTLNVTYDLHGLCVLPGDASAVIFDQGGTWHFVSLADFGQNCLDGTQTVTVPLSDFAGLNTSSPVGTLHGRFWYSGSFAVDISSMTLTATGTTPPPPPTATNLLTAAWNLTGNNSASEKYQTIAANSLAGNDTLTLTYDLHGLCALGGDASAVIFDQGGTWNFASLANYGQNCFSGSQTISIPLSDFTGLDATAPVGTFHTRFWYGSAFTVDITSAVLSAGAATPPPSSSGPNLLTAAWNLSGSNSASEQYQTIDPNALNGYTTLNLTYDLRGLCALAGDASAIVFDQGGTWHFVSLADFGQNCLNGSQTVAIPFSSFTGLNTIQPVGTFHTRFWNSTPFDVTISSAVLFK